MTDRQNLLLNPLFRYGMPAMSAVVIAAMAFLLIEDQTVRVTMLLVAAADLLVTPWILKRARKEQATDPEPRDI